MFHYPFRAFLMVDGRMARASMFDASITAKSVDDAASVVADGLRCPGHQVEINPDASISVLVRGSGSVRLMVDPYMVASLH